MLIGVPKEIKKQEERVGAMPSASCNPRSGRTPSSS